MLLSSDEFGDWVKVFYGNIGIGFSWSQAALDAKMRTPTLAMQRSRNRVDAVSIIEISRTYGRSPISELASIRRFSQSLKTKEIPSLDILLTAHPVDIMKELIYRLNRYDIEPHKRDQVTSWGLWPYGIATLIDYRGEDSRARIREALGIKASALEDRLYGSIKFRVDEILEGFSSIDIHPVLGLVLLGYLTESEAGLPIQIKQRAIEESSDEELLKVLKVQQKNVGRSLKDLDVLDRHIQLN